MVAILNSVRKALPGKNHGAVYVRLLGRLWRRFWRRGRARVFVWPAGHDGLCGYPINNDGFGRQPGSRQTPNTSLGSVLMWEIKWAGRFARRGFLGGAGLLGSIGGALAQGPASDGGLATLNILGFGAVLVAIIAVAGALRAFISSRRMRGSSLFNRLFIVVATTSAFFSAISSAIGFSLITSQENEDFLRNAVLPPAFGVFVFFLAVAIWVGGAELVRHRDWFRQLRGGALADGLFFLERGVKLFVVIPVLATILFFVSTWTTVVGIGGVDAVRYTYGQEVSRLQAECEGISAWRQRDLLFLEDLRLAVSDVARAARKEREGGAQTGSVGRGQVSAYFAGVAEWLAALEQSVGMIVESDDPSGVDPFVPGFCAARADDLSQKLSTNAHENYDLWLRGFATRFEELTNILNRWRRDRRIERLLETQLANFDRANPKPFAGDNRLSQGQRDAIDRYAQDVEKALKGLIRKQKLAKPPEPLKSAAEKSPARGLAIIATLISPVQSSGDEKKKSRTQAVVATEFVPGLSEITPRDAVLKNANIFSDVWALAIAWDYASYVLMLAYLFFPSAERAAGFKD